MSEAASASDFGLRSFANGNRLRLAAVLTVAVLAIAGVSAHRYVTLERELTEAALARRAALAALAATTLSEKLERLVDIGTALATRVRFQELVAAGRWAEAIQILRRVPEDFAYLDRVFVADVRGTLTADTPELPGVRGTNFADRDWFKGVSGNWQPYVSQLYRRAAAPRRQVIAIAVPIRSVESVVAGILVLQVKLETFFEWARRIDFGPGARVLVVDRDGHAAFDSTVPLETSAQDPGVTRPVRRLNRGASGVEIEQGRATGEERVVSYAAAAHGWGVVIEQPADTTFAGRNELLEQLLIDAGLIGLLAVAAIALATGILLQRRRAQADRAYKQELEKRVAERTAELKALNAELESFSYSVSHDLRAPLRAIDGYSRMIEEDYDARLDDEGRRLIAVVRESAARMRRMIDDLLEFSRIGRKALAMAPVEMNALAKEVAAELQRASPRAQVEIGALPMARGDPALLRQVWANLIGNALKYSGKRETPRIEIGGRVEGDRALYWVDDNGAGFDMRYAGKLFGVFQRLHQEDEFPGTGVGLAIVQRILTRHGGRVWAEGQPDKGATFRFALPLGKEPLA